jgi:competence protein ComEA
MNILYKSLPMFCLLASLCLLMVSPFAGAQEQGVDIEIININTADVVALANGLNGIGDKKAQAIVDYRESVGAFKAVDELAEVNGIGSTMVELNRNRIVLK